MKHLAPPSNQRCAPLGADPNRCLLTLGFVLLCAAQSSAASDLRSETQARFDRITDLVYVAPCWLQQALIDSSWRVYSEWLRNPSTAAPPDPRLAADYASLDTRLQEFFPVRRVEWSGNGLSLLDRPEPLPLARGLEVFVLVEVTNSTPSALSCTATFPGKPRAVQAPVTIPAGAARTLWAGLTATDTSATAVPLNLSDAGGNPLRSVALPMVVSEPARIRGQLIEGAAGQVSPARVHVLGSDGIYRRDAACGTNDTLSTKPILNFMFAGLGKSYTFPFFYSDGSFEILVPAGPTKITLERGFEHPLVSTNLHLKPGETRKVTLESRRFLDMKQRGWVSGDTHIHWAKNWWSENEDIKLLAMVQRAEDVRVANNLTLKHHTTNQNFIAPTQFPMGPIPGYCSEDWHMEMAEEYRNEEFYGHLIFLNLKRLIEPISTGFMGGPPFWDYPPNLPAILDARAQGGVVIEAHGLGNDADVPANVAHELADSLDQIEPDDYYRFLECGFQLPLSNGSDHPARVVGSARVYVKTKLPFSYANWIEGLRQNRTFTTSGPLLFLDVNGKDLGEVIAASPNTPLKMRVRAVSRFPLGVVQIVSNGKVIAEKKTSDRDTELSVEIPAGEPRWIVARCSAGVSFNAINERDIAHTAAIYVAVNGQQRFAPEAAREWANRLRRHAENIRRQGRFPTAENRDEAVDYVLDAARIFEASIERHEKGTATTQLSSATQALISHARNVAAGLALHATDRNALASLERYGETGACETIERVLSRHTLFRVNINPEMRVKVAAGAAPARLIPGRMQFFLARIENESGTTAPLQVQAADPTATGSRVWLDASVVTREALPATLSGARLEYRLIGLMTQEIGQREARISLHVGQGTQDLGFRNEVAILFDCRPESLPTQNPTK